MATITSVVLFGPANASSEFASSPGSSPGVYGRTREAHALDSAGCSGAPQVADGSGKHRLSAPISRPNSGEL